MLKDTLFKELRASLESVNIEEIVPEIYAGSEVAEELLACDDNDNLLAACESQSEAFTAIAFENQEIVLESMGLTLPEFGKVTESLGNEAIVNAVKRGAYNVVIAVKKALKKVMALVMAVVDFFILADGKWKSYSKLFKKYKEKLIRVKPSMAEKDADKTYNIRKHAKAKDVLNLALAAISDISTLKQSITGLNSNNLASKLIDLCTIINRGLESLVEKTVEGKGSKKIETVSLKTAQEINDFIDAETSKDRVAEIKAEIKEAHKTLEASFKEVEEVPAKDVVGQLITTLSELEKATAKDTKYLKDLKKIKAEIDKAIDKLENDGKGEDLFNSYIRLLAFISNSLNAFKYEVSKLVKMATGMMQGVLADAAKVIAGETRVTE